MKSVVISIAVLTLVQCFVTSSNRLTAIECGAYYQPKINNVSASIQYSLALCENEKTAKINESLSMLQDTKDDNDSKINDLNEYLDDCHGREENYEGVKCYQDFQGSFVLQQTSSQARTALKKHALNLNIIDLSYSSCQFSASNKANMETQQLFNDYNHCIVKGEIPSEPTIKLYL